MKRDLKLVGTITLNEQVMVSDPCYDSNSTCSCVVDNVLNGTYNCFVETSNEGRWGVRVAKMLVLHTDFNPSFLTRYEGIWESDVCVDSGTMSISDLGYYDKYHINDNNDDAIGERNDEWYDKNVCEWAMEKNSHIADDLSFISSSGYGDGRYAVYTYGYSGNTIAIEVVFIEEDEDDE